MSLKQEELDKQHKKLKGACSRCNLLQDLYYDNNETLKCRVCHSMNVEILYMEIDNGLGFSRED